MRLHRLSAEAFGPFAGRVDVDFDALSEAGIFLVHGPTGSGKTSLLDAVCFALFGRVPGVRPAGGSLRSDHAGPEARPEVTVELTVADRRLRVTRSPEHQRPKRRGAGLTAVRPFVQVEELVGGQWTSRATRVDEAGDLLAQILGMGLDQFVKVVVLPQGDFAAFLRATPEARREVLERLFDIGRFAGVEEWFVARRGELRGALAETRHTLDTHRLRLADVLTRLSPEVATGLPGMDELSAVLTTDGPGAIGDGVPASARAALETVSAGLAEHAAATLADRDLVERRLDTAETALREAITLTDRAARGSRARGVLDELAGQAGSRARARSMLADADRAARVAGDLRALDLATEDRSRAHDALVPALDRLRRLGLAIERRAADGTVPDEVTPLVALLTDADPLVAEVARLLPVIEATRAARQAAADRVATAAARLESVQSGLARVAQDAILAEARIEAAVAAAAEARRALEESAALVSAASARERADGATRRLHLLTGLAQQARAEAQQARQDELDLRERRLTAMAGELAESLRDGEQCPVCGGLEHPAPARRADRVTDADIERASAATVPLLEQAQRLGEDAAAAAAELAACRAAVGTETRDGTALRAEAAAVAARAERAAAAAAEGVAAQTLLTELGERERTLGIAHDEAVAARAEATARLAALDEQCAADVGALDRAVDRHTKGCPCAQPATLVTTPPAAIGPRHQAVREAVAAAAEAARDADAAAQRLADRLTHTESACRAEGFDSVAQAVTARMPRAAADRLRESLAETQRREAAAESVLADPEVMAALSAAPIDLDGVGRAARAARAAYAAASREHAFAEAAAQDVAGLAGELTAAWSAWHATLLEERQVARLADTVTGLGPDNALRMRLSAFVLAGRLERVVELANERLAGLGSGRYRLAHSDEPAPGGRRSGLGLAVDDLWTGQRRDPATLSGGESFLASLALALGLADAVREDGGGLEVATLFVDEGFGALDEDCLEEVMGLLDQLREGGRSVGVISHVADLRTRIPAQVRVTKSATGSTVEQGGTAA